MYRISPRHISDPLRLSNLLDRFLETLEQSPLHVPLRQLSYDTGIPVPVLYNMSRLHNAQEPTAGIEAADFYFLFSCIQFRYPTIQIYETPDGNWYFVL